MSNQNEPDGESTQDILSVLDAQFSYLPFPVRAVAVSAFIFVFALFSSPPSELTLEWLLLFYFFILIGVSFSYFQVWRGVEKSLSLDSMQFRLAQVLLVAIMAYVNIYILQNILAHDSAYLSRYWGYFAQNLLFVNLLIAGAVFAIRKIFQNLGPLRQIAKDRAKKE